MRRFHLRELIWSILGELTAGLINKMKKGETGLYYRENEEIGDRLEGKEGHKLLT